MKKRTKKEMLNMPPLPFWKETIIYYRNKVKQSPTKKELVENLDVLAQCREQLAWVESRILHGIIAVIVLVSIFLSGCQFVSGCGSAIGGLGGDIKWAADGYIEEARK